VYCVHVSTSNGALTGARTLPEAPGARYEITTGI